MDVGDLCDTFYIVKAGQFSVKKHDKVEMARLDAKL